MTRENAVEFLKKMATDTDIRASIIDGYKKLIVQAGGNAGLEFTPEELEDAAKAAKNAAYGEIPDSALEMVTGGAIFNSSFDSGMQHLNETMGTKPK